MPDTDFAPIVEALLDARSVPRRIATPTVRSLAEAQAIQTGIAHRTGGLGTWKIALSSAGDMIFAPILAPTVAESPAAFPVPHFNMIGIEGEIVVSIATSRLGGGPCTPARIAGAITAVRAAIEIVDTRLADWPDVTPLAVIADNAASGALVLGAAIDEAAAVADRPPGFEIHVNGVLTAPPAPNKVGSLTPAVARLIEQARDSGMILPGELNISTGSHTGLIFVSPGDHVALIANGRTLAEAQF